MTTVASTRREPALERLLDLHRSMVRIRVFEERVADLAKAGEIRGPTHLYTGQEAIAAGVGYALRKEDYVLGNHRSHGHYLAKGGDLRALMAEIYCRLDGCSKGRGGSMHIIAPEVGVLGTVPMVAGTIPVAVGAGLSAKLRNSGQVAVSFFGDSATEEGVFHESVNFAALHRLPVILVCENNGFSSHLRLHRRRTFDDLSSLVEPYGIPSKRIDGNDVLAVHDAAAEAVRRARFGQGPSFLEFVTHRWRGHVGPNYDLDVGIRDDGEVESWMARCPIRALEARLASQSSIEPARLAAVWDEATREVESAVVFARGSPTPQPRSVHDHVFIERGV